jgi:hypothetical protein
MDIYALLFMQKILTTTGVSVFCGNASYWGLCVLWKCKLLGICVLWKSKYSLQQDFSARDDDEKLCLKDSSPLANPCALLPFPGHVLASDWLAIFVS